jgi:hypothetical protein
MNLSLTSSSVSFDIALLLLHVFDNLCDIDQFSDRRFSDFNEHGGSDILVSIELGDGASTDVCLDLKIALQSAFVDELLSQ